MRRALAGVVVLVMLLLVGRATADLIGHPKPGHVEWTEYDVDTDGWIICRPVGDSAECMTLPKGTEFYVPHWEKGEDPSVEQERKWHSASLR